jgi:hypothetical protein
VHSIELANWSIFFHSSEYLDLDGYRGGAELVLEMKLQAVAAESGRPKCLHQAQWYPWQDEPGPIGSGHGREEPSGGHGGEELGLRLTEAMAGGARAEVGAGNGGEELGQMSATTMWKVLIG